VTRIVRSVLVPYSAADMYGLVSDVDGYHRFLPWCGGSRVIGREGDVVMAAVDIAFSGVHKTFVTQNRGVPGERLDIRLVEGPFRALEGHWRFDSLGNAGCKVTLDLEFDFSNPVTRMVVGPVFQKIASELVDSFRARADEVFGSRQA
jgi:ribosome-associated toxin RatA of RatAB toxin-antitoxin module